ncbi:MAG TPA: hypothetical protein VMH90_03485, partial [Thermoplasmata archaeon]|nr:hypothetical protein [Thermoplasmata archaeon]
MRVFAGSGAVVACLLMISASGAGASHIYLAPWSKALVTPTNVIVELSGCAKMTGKPSHFAKSTGIATWQGSAQAQSCKGALGATQTSDALEQYASGITYPVKVPAGT